MKTTGRKRPASESLDWKRRYEELKQFRKQHGHCNVPNRYPPNQRLSSWVMNLRTRRKQGRLDREAIRQLDALGFSWELRRRRCLRYDWDEMVAALKAFKKRHGHSNVPGPWRDRSELAAWLNETRKKRRYGRLDASRIHELDELGVDWNPPPKNQWEKQYAALVKYQEKHGDCQVPLQWPKNPSLGSWVAVLRKVKRQNKLADDWIERLDEIGFDWDYRAKPWQVRYAELAEYRRQNGHCRVPVVSNLGRWVRYMRVQRQQGHLSQEQIQQLDRLGFVWRCLEA